MPSRSSLPSTGALSPRDHCCGTRRSTYGDLPQRAVRRDRRAGVAGQRHPLWNTDRHGCAGTSARRALPRHSDPHPSGGNQPGRSGACAGHEPAAARIPADSTGAEAVLQHQRPRRRAGLAVSYLLARSQRGPWRQFLNSTPTVIATVDAALAAAIVMLAARATAVAAAWTIAAGTAAFSFIWAALFVQERQTLKPLSRARPRFPTPPG